MNKFLGDGLLALFDEEDSGPHHALAALHAANELVAVADELRRRGGIWTTLRVGVGLDSGPVVVGVVGASDRLEFTAIGATVNRAARLQGLSATATKRIVMSAECADLVESQVAIESLGRVVIKGYDSTIPIFGLARTIPDTDLAETRRNTFH